MYLRIIHPNLLKFYAKRAKILSRETTYLNISNKNLILFLISFLLFSSFTLANVLAASAVLVSVDDGNDRIVATEENSVTLRFNITNQPGSTDAITIINITNATNYNVSSVNATGNSTQACTINQLSVNCTGLNIPAGSSLLINLTVGTPNPGSSGVGTWTVDTKDSAGTTSISNVFTAAIDKGEDIAFDIRDELGNVTGSATVQVVNGTNNNLLFSPGNDIKTDNTDGLVIFEFGSDIIGTSGSDTFAFNISREGFVNVSGSSQSYSRSGTTTNGFKPSGLPYGIKVTVQDELGNPLTGATINITQLPITPSNPMDSASVSTPNATTANVQYFALPARFDNATIIVTRSGFLDNETFDNQTSTTWPVNATTQTVGNSPYQLIFVLKVNVTDELGSGSGFHDGVTLAINGTDTTANQSSNNVYYFSIGWAGANVTVAKAGYVNASSNEIPLNTSKQASVNPKLKFRLKVTVQNELSGTTGMNFGVTIALNGTDSSPNSSSTNNYYFNISDAGVNISVAKSGFINTSSTEWPLNDSAQAAVTIKLPFAIKVTDLCNEIGGPGHCFAMDGTESAVEVSGDGDRSTTYNSGDAYLNATTGVSATTVTINASKDGYVNSTLTIITNQSTQAVVVFNATGGSPTDRGSGLPFTVKTLAVYDELGQRNFTLNGTGFNQDTKQGAAVDVLGQLNNVFYQGPSAFVNATGTNTVTLVAYLPNQTFVNSSVGVTPTAASQQTVLFNATNGLNADVTGSGLKYIIKITVQDELGQSTNMDSGVVIALNNSDRTIDASSGNSYYLTNVTGELPGWVNVSRVARNGYINSTNSSFTTPSNNPLTPINASNQTVYTVQLKFNVKVMAEDELGNDFSASAVNFTANNTGINTPNSTSGVFAYYALPLPSIASTGKAYINMSKIGFVDNSTSTFLINTSTQALQNISMAFTVRVDIVCDELNVTCFTLDGSLDSDGAGGAAVDGLTTSYTTGPTRAYIPAPNDTSSTVVAFARGYVNTSISVIPSATSRNITIAFNTTPNTTTTVNTSALKFTVRVTSVCDQLNFTCFTLDGSADTIGSAGINVTDANTRSSSAVNTTQYSNGIAYIAVPGTSAVNLIAFSRGFINSTQAVTPTPASDQVDVTWNSSIYGLNYTVKLTVNDELGNPLSSNVVINTNNTDLAENVSVFRSSSSSNVFYINATVANVSTTGGVNVSSKKDGYVNSSSTEIPINSSKQAELTHNMLFSVKIVTQDQDGNSYSGASVQIVDNDANTWTINDGNVTVSTKINGVSSTNTSGSVGDVNSSSDGFIYWALNQSNITNKVEVIVMANREGYETWRVTGRTLSYSTQLSLTSSNLRDTTPPAAPASVTATIVSNNATHREVRVTWTASTSTDVDYYRIYRNNTLLATSSETAFTDYPNAGIFVYNITTVDTAGNVASSNTTSSAVSLGELIGPTINITSPQSGDNVTSTTPTIKFTIIDNDGGVGIDLSTIAVNISGFNATKDCTRNNDLNYSCSYTASTLTDLVNHTISITAKDKFGNAASNATRNFGVNTLANIAVSLNTSNTNGTASNTYGTGWTFTFNLTLGSSTSNATSINATRVKMDDWKRIGGTETIPVTGNAVMNYTDASGTARAYNITTTFNETETIFPLQDLDTKSLPINATVTISMKIPASTTPGIYRTTFTFGSYSVPLTGG